MTVSALRAVSTSHPFISGRRMSNTTAAGCVRWTVSKPSGPSRDRQPRHPALQIQRQQVERGRSSSMTTTARPLWVPARSILRAALRSCPTESRSRKCCRRRLGLEPPCGRRAARGCRLDGCPKPVPSCCCTPGRPAGTIEDALAIVGRDPDPGVAHRHHELGPSTRARAATSRRRV